MSWPFKCFDSKSGILIKVNSKKTTYFTYVMYLKHTSFSNLSIYWNQAMAEIMSILFN